MHPRPAVGAPSGTHDGRFSGTPIVGVVVSLLRRVDPKPWLPPR